jgi:hypothetical protein
MIVGDPYNVFCRYTHVEIDGAPAGPLRGLTLAVKEVFDIAGHRTGNGNPVWLETHAPAGRGLSKACWSAWSISHKGQQRPIRTVDDESGLPPTADELLRHGKRRKGPTADIRRGGRKGR